MPRLTANKSSTTPPLTTREEWDCYVVAHAQYFVVMKVVARVMRGREEYTSFDLAVRSARAWRGPHGQRAMIYAVTPEGRDAHISERDWPKYAGYVATGPLAQTTVGTWGR